MRPSALSVHKPAPSVVDDLAADVRRGLGTRPKQLPPRWLYDAIGSSLFEAICLLPWYKITRAETRMLDRVAPEIALRLPRVTEVVELGPGSGDKLARLLGPFARHSSPVVAHLIDVSADALADATERLSKLPLVEVRAHLTTFAEGLASLDGRGRRGRLVALLGSNIGNFDPGPADDLMRAIAGALEPGDACLLGADLVKPEAVLLEAYDDPIGVTAAFNRNLLSRINRELGARFDPRDFDHQARWNARARRVEMHLVSRRRHAVAIPGAGIDCQFDAGESIWTESSYKYDMAELAAFGAAAGLSAAAQWVDDDARFALTLYIKPGQR